jgi:HSP20 family molecular chaperone IbpA
MENKPEQKENKQPESIVGSIAGGLIPGFGKLINMMQKTPEFEEKLKEAESEISFRLGRGGMPKPRVAFNYSIRPLTHGGFQRIVKEEEPKTIVVWEETPPVEKEDLKVYPIGKKLIIETKDKKYKKEVPLAYYVRDIEIDYQKGKDKGLLIVRMKKR